MNSKRFVIFILLFQVLAAPVMADSFKIAEKDQIFFLQKEAEQREQVIRMLRHNENRLAEKAEERSGWEMLVMGLLVGAAVTAATR